MTTFLGDSLRALAVIADAIDLDEALVNPNQHFQVTVRTWADVARFAQMAGLQVQTWQDGDTWFATAEIDLPVRFRVIAFERIPRELRLPQEQS